MIFRPNRKWTMPKSDSTSALALLWAVWHPFSGASFGRLFRRSDQSRLPGVSRFDLYRKSRAVCASDDSGGIRAKLEKKMQTKIPRNNANEHEKGFQNEALKKTSGPKKHTKRCCHNFLSILEAQVPTFSQKTRGPVGWLVPVADGCGFQIRKEVIFIGSHGNKLTRTPKRKCKTSRNFKSALNIFSKKQAL